jgi:hypothetical protein
MRTKQQGGDTLLIHEKEIRKFIIDHPAEFDMRKCDQLWLIDLLANGSTLCYLLSPNLKMKSRRNEQSKEC